MQLVSRREWGARVPKSTPQWLASTRGVKVHFTGAYVDPRLADDHDRCAAAVKGIQRAHMIDNGWNDIAYNFVACPHRYVFEGRGLHRLPSANGPELNAGHYAVLGLVGNKGLTVPTNGLLNGILDAVDYCRREGGAGAEILGHRDGYDTDCPGPELYAWVRKGAPRPMTPTEELVKELPELKRGAKGEDVETLQALLIARSHPEVKITGQFDAVTDAAVRAVQRWGRVTADGVVGSTTWPVLLRVHG